MPTEENDVIGALAELLQVSLPELAPDETALRDYLTARDTIAGLINTLRTFPDTPAGDVSAAIAGLETTMSRAHGVAVGGKKKDYPAGAALLRSAIPGADEAIKQARAHLAEVRAERQRANEEAKKQLRKSIRCASQLKVLEDAIAALSGDVEMVPLAKAKKDEAAVKLQAARDELAKDEADRDYSAALKALDEGTACAQAAQGLFAKALKKAGSQKDTREHFKAYTELRDRVEGDEAVPDAEKRARFSAPFDELNRLLLKGSFSGDDASRFTQVLAQATKEYNELSEELSRKRAAARASIDDARSGMDELLDYLLPGDIIEQYQALREAEDAFEAREYDKARADADGLKDIAILMLDEAKPARERWEALAKSIPAVEQKLDEQKALMETITFPNDPRGLSLQLMTIQAGVLQRSLRFAPASEQFEALARALEENSARLLSMDSLGGDIDSWDARVQEAAGKVDAALVVLVDAVKGIDAKAADKTAASYQDRKEAILSVWATAKKALDTQKDVEKAAAWIQELEKLAAEITGTAGDPEALRGAVDAGLLKQAKADFLAAHKDCQDRLVALNDLDAASVDALKAMVAKPYQAGTASEDVEVIGQSTALLVDLHGAELARALAEANRRKADLIREIAQLRAQVGDQLDLLDKRITEHRSGFGGFMRRTFGVNDKAEFAKYLPILRKEFDEVAGLCDSAFPGLLEEAKAALLDIQGEIVRTEKAFAGGKKGQDKRPSLTSLQDAIKAEEARISGNDEVKKRCPAGRKLLQEQLKTIKGAVGTELITKTERALLTWKRDYEDLAKQAHTETEEMVAFIATYQELKDELKANKKTRFPDHREYFEKLVADMKAARDLSGKEGMFDSAKASLEAVKQAVANSRDGRKLQAGADALTESNEQAEQERERWEGELESFKREFMDPLEKAIASKQSSFERFKAFFSDPALLKEVKTLRDQAVASADKGDYQMARFQLGSARSRADHNMRFPDGTNAARLKEVEAVTASWRTAVGGYRDNLQAVCGGIAAALEEDADKGAVQAVAGDLRLVFHDDLFDGVVARMTADGADAKALRAQREAGLALVRGCRERLLDGRIQALADNPFGQSFTGHFLLGKALTDIERTILLSTSEN